MFVTSAADVLVAPDVTDFIEEALRQARLPYEILIKDVQVQIALFNYSFQSVMLTYLHFIKIFN